MNTKKKSKQYKIQEKARLNKPKLETIKGLQKSKENKTNKNTQNKKSQNKQNKGIYVS